MLPSFRVIFFASVISFFANFQFGYQITYINTAINDFYLLANKAHEVQNHCYNCSLTYTSWTDKWSISVSSLYPGCFLGFVLVPFLMPRVGLKSLLTISCVPAIFGCILQIFVRFFAQYGEFPFFATLIAGRFLIGIHAGVALSLLPIYFVESSSQHHRQFLSSFQQVFQSFSTLIGLICGSDVLFSLGSYKIEYLQIIGFVAIIIFFAVLLKMPETPATILKSNMLDTNVNKKFEKSAKFYLGKDSDIEEFKIEAYDRMHASARYNGQKVLSKENIKGLIIGSVASISYGFTGDDIIDSYSSQILFRHTKGSAVDAEMITILFGVVLVLSSIGGSVLIDRFGNRRLLIFGLIGTAASNLFASIGSVFGSTIIVSVGFSLTKAFIGLGAGAPSWFLTSELVSANLTYNCQAISTGLLLISIGVITTIYLPLETHLNELATLLLTSLPAVLCAIFIFMFLPETKDRRLERIRSHLGRYLFSGIKALPKDNSSRHSSLDQLRKSRLHSYGSMNTMRLPSISVNSSDTLPSSTKNHNKVYAAVHSLPSFQ